MQVSVRELRDHLSHYLHKMNELQVSIIVTSHSVSIARLSPISHMKGKQGADLVSMGGASWNGKKPMGSKKRPKIMGKTLSDYVLEDRR